DREENCTLLPVLAGCLALSENSVRGRALGAKYLARAKAMPAGDARSAAWLAATDAWLAGDCDRSLAIHETLVAQWPRDLLAGAFGQLHAFNIGDPEAL